jgi:hypothetical protein
MSNKDVEIMSEVILAWVEVLEKHLETLEPK